MKERPILFKGEMVRAILEGGNDARRVRIDEQWLRLRFAAGATTAEMADEIGCSTHPVKKAMRRLGLRRAAKRRPGVGGGKTNSAWKGGRRIRSDGYVAVWTPGGERLEHQVVVESLLGRSLTSGEVVHHIDSVRSNNAPANLQLTTQSEHIRHHLSEMHAARYGR